MVVPVGIPFNGYASEVAKKLHEAGFCAEADTDDSNTMNKKVRNAQIAQFNFIFGNNMRYKQKKKKNGKIRCNFSCFSVNHIFCYKNVLVHNHIVDNLAILVVGEKEKNNGTVNVRTRDNKVS